MANTAISNQPVGIDLAALLQAREAREARRQQAQQSQYEREDAREQRGREMEGAQYQYEMGLWADDNTKHEKYIEQRNKDALTGKYKNREEWETQWGPDWEVGPRPAPPGYRRGSDRERGGGMFGGPRAPASMMDHPNAPSVMDLMQLMQQEGQQPGGLPGMGQPGGGPAAMQPGPARPGAGPGSGAFSSAAPPSGGSDMPFMPGGGVSPFGGNTGPGGPAPGPGGGGTVFGGGGNTAFRPNTMDGALPGSVVPVEGGGIEQFNPQSGDERDSQGRPDMFQRFHQPAPEGAERPEGDGIWGRNRRRVTDEQDRARRTDKRAGATAKREHRAELKEEAKAMAEATMHAGPGGRPEMDEDEMLRRLRGHRSTGTEDQEFFRKQVGIAAGKQRTAGVMAGMKRADDAMAEVGHLNAERDKLITRRGAILDKTTVDRPALSRIDRKIASLDTMIATATGVDITEQRQPFNKDTKDSLNQIGDAQASIEALLEIREQLEKHGFPVLGIAGKAGKFFQSARGFARGVDSALGGGSTFKDLYDGGVNDLFEDAAAGSEYAQSMLDEWSASRATPGAFAKAFSSEESRARTQVDVATKIMAYRLARLISGKTSRLAFADTEQVRSMLDFDTMGQSPERARDQVDILLHEARRSYRGYRKVFEMDPAFGDAYLDRWGYSRHWGETGVEGSVPGGISSGGPRPTISDATAEVLSEGAP